MAKAAASSQSPLHSLFLRSAGAALFSLAVTPGLAADLALKSRPPAPRPPARFTWTSLYLGINGGYGWGRLNTSNQDGDTFALNSKGGIVGGTVGFNYQWAWFVGGVEGDLDWSGMPWSQTSPVSQDVSSGFRRPVPSPRHTKTTS